MVLGLVLEYESISSITTNFEEVSNDSKDMKSLSEELEDAVAYFK